MRFCCIGLWTLFLTTGTVQAHFIWILPAEKGDSAGIVWSDYPKPDNVEDPLENIAKAEVLLRNTEGRVETLKWKQDKDLYRVMCPGSGIRTLAVIWNNEKSYKGGTLTTFVGKVYLADPAGKASVPAKVSAWEQLGLEILLCPDRGPDIYQVVYKGRPVATTRVVPNTPAEDVLPVVTSDKDGLFTFMAPKPGLYGLEVRHEVAEKGQYKGKEFTRRRYISTLVIQVSATREKKDARE